MSRLHPPRHDDERQSRLRRRLAEPHKYRLTYKIYADTDLPSRRMIVLSRIAAALLTAFAALFSVLCLQFLLAGYVNVFTVVFLIIMLPSAFFAGRGVFHKNGLYYLRVYESETYSKKGAPPEAEREEEAP